MVSVCGPGPAAAEGTGAESATTQPIVRAPVASARVRIPIPTFLAPARADVCGTQKGPPLDQSPCLPARREREAGVARSTSPRVRLSRGVLRLCQSETEHSLTSHGNRPTKECRMHLTPHEQEKLLV